MNDDSGGAIGCACALLVLLVCIALGGVATNYIIAALFHANIPFFWDEVIGFILGGALIPLAVIVWILKYFHAI